jgi:NADPH:quinone reductase-like Zn-dependent oxidoreductase
MKVRRIIRWTAVAIPLVLLAWFSIAYVSSANNCDELLAATPRTPVKAVVYCDYGGPDVLEVVDIEKPAPADNQLLIKVRAVGLNPFDWHYMRGTPYVMRLDSGLRKPKSVRLGVDYAGTVEAVGRSVTRFKPGDEVFGGRNGALAEEITVLADGAVTLKPANVTFEQAAGVGIAASTALQGLRDKGQIQPGQKVLINGASGGVGTFAVQIAKSYGAHVTGVCSTRNVELVKSLGADRVFDYTKEDFTTTSERYDLVIDNVGNRALSEVRRILTPEGKYILIGGGGPEDHTWIGPLGRVAQTLVLSPFVDQELGMFLSNLNNKDLAVLADLMQAGKVASVIDRRYTLTQTPEAIRYLETGRARGKVIVSVE